jgi:hypothetical protein
MKRSTSNVILTVLLCKHWLQLGSLTLSSLSCHYVIQIKKVEYRKKKKLIVVPNIVRKNHRFWFVLQKVRIRFRVSCCLPLLYLIPKWRDLYGTKDLPKDSPNQVLFFKFLFLTPFRTT